MTWHATCPDGTRSVKANKAIIQDNTTYTEVTMGNSVVGTNTVDTRDHFWNVGSNEDGRHRFIQSPKFTVGGVATDPVLGTGMDGVTYIKEDGLTPTRVQGFYRNAEGVYQYLPAFLTGTADLSGSTGSYHTVVAVPNNVYGDIFMFRENSSGDFVAVTGFFRSRTSGGTPTVDAWAICNHIEVSGDARTALVFGCGSTASGLNIRARVDDGSASANWGYRITYRAI